ncbi:hypothetical protein JCM30760_03440 [Thiomicrorhabdus hydrogeniphila]
MNKYKQVQLAVALATISSAAFAIDPASLDFEGIEVTPTLEVSGTYDDNYQATSEEKSSWITSITPAVNVAIYGRNAVYNINYALNHQLYEASGSQNLTNHHLNATADYQFDIRNALTVEAGYNKTESATSTYTPGELNSFSTKNLGASYTYGAPTATGNLELGANYEQYRSENGVNLDQERNSTSASATFLYKITDKTKLTAEVRGTQFDYIESTSLLDSTNLGYFVGARWEATAKTEGHIKIGKENKDFDSSSLKDTDLNSWEVSVDWAPLTYSVITLTSNQKIDEGSYDSSYTNTTNNEIKWVHDWGRGYSSNVNYTNTNRDYVTTNREDTINAYGIGLTYEAKRWMDIAFDYQASHQDSTDTNYDFNRNIFQLTLNISL